MVGRPALTRDGRLPRNDREHVALALATVLNEGTRFVDPEAGITADEIRGWVERVTTLGRDLADCIEAPARNAVIETLLIESLPDDMFALEALRINVVGASHGQLGEDVGVAGRTIERLEQGDSCHVRVAKQVADHFALRVTELFDPDSLKVREVGELRRILLDGEQLERLGIPGDDPGELEPAPDPAPSVELEAEHSVEAAMRTLAIYKEGLKQHPPDDWLTIEVAPAYPDDPP